MKDKGITNDECVADIPSIVGYYDLAELLPLS
jgi:hypothetical protein